MQKNLAQKILMLTIIILIPIIILVSLTSTKKPQKDIFFERAKILEVLDEKLSQDRIVPGIYVGTQNIELEILSGAFKGTRFTLTNTLSRIYNIHTKENMTVIVQIFAKGGSIQSLNVYSYYREPGLYTLAVLFMIAMIVFGGMKGFKSVLSLTFTGVLVVFFMIPLILHGANPILLALITVAISSVATFLLVSGFNKKSLSASIGTIIGITLAGLISYIAANSAHLSGLTTEEAEGLILISEITHLQVRGLMFTAILIASMGAIIDMGMSIASSVFEVHSTNPHITGKELFQSGMNIGKDTMGTMSSTLILALTGGALNYMLLITANSMPYTQIMNLDLICSELIQAISGSIGIIFTIPVTSAVSVWLAKK